MKNLLPWIKANLLVVIALGVTLLLLPTALFFAGSWNSSIKSSITSEVGSAVQKLQGLKVTYSLPAAGPDQPAVNEPSCEPTEAKTTAYIERLKAIEAAGEKVKLAAEKRNKAGKAPLIEGLFPEPADESARIKKLSEFPDVFHAAQEKLLKDANAGGPLSNDSLLVQLQTLSDQLSREITRARENQKLSTEELATIQKKLIDQRIALLQARASQVRFFAGMEVFDGGKTSAGAGSGSAGSGSGSGGGPGGMPGGRPGGGGGGGGGAGGPGGGTPGAAGAAPVLMTLEQAWEWQTAFWVEQDVIAALVKANTGSSGQQLSVLNGAVKRLAVLTVHDQGETPGGTPGAPGPNAGGGGGAGGAGGAPAAENAGGAGSETTEVPRDYKYSPTGRSSHNGFYDTRVADVVMICDSSRLPLILNAINTTNFMSVSNLDVRALTDPTADQGAGYYYGDGHLVLATLQIETAWLRSWTKPLMPKDVRKKLGIPDDAPAAPTDPAAAGGASAPPGNAGSGTPGKPQ